VRTRRPLVGGVFTSEEGGRFAPGMPGSLVYAGGLSRDEALARIGIDGKRLEDELTRIGYAGDAPLPLHRPHAHIELHVEQGPVLGAEGIAIGAVLTFKPPESDTGNSRSQSAADVARRPKHGDEVSQADPQTVQRSPGTKSDRTSARQGIEVALPIRSRDGIGKTGRLRRSVARAGPRQSA